VVEGQELCWEWPGGAGLHSVSFRVQEGITGLLGANGAGKTTLLNLVLGLLPPQSGSLRVLGLDPSRAGPNLRARLGFAPEHDAFPPDVSATDLVRHVAELHGLDRKTALARASDALWEVGLGEERFRPVGTLSTGQRQRVKLAQAIAHDPELLLLDEPTNGLDPSQREEMLALVRHVGHDLGMNVLLSSHLLEEVEKICQAVVILDEGKVVRSGELDRLSEQGQELLVELDGLGEHGEGGPAGALAQRLLAQGVQSSLQGPNRLSVVIQDEAVYDQVRDAIDDGRLALLRLERRRLRLEDIYLSIAGAPHPPTEDGGTARAGEGPGSLR